MIFTETKLKGAFIIDLYQIRLIAHSCNPVTTEFLAFFSVVVQPDLILDKKEDSRGFFARTFCINEFEDRGLKPTVVQCNLSFNYKKGTMRGMHYQKYPSTETKLVRCIRGAIYDVIIDLRPESPTYLSYIGVELTAENHRALYVPDNFAHQGKRISKAIDS
jgi:dTDP-4-dehydrorhamnose 3,5-epimerase